MRTMRKNLENIKAGRRCLPSQADRVIQMFEPGADLNYYGPAPATGRRRRPPRARTDSRATVEKLWKLEKPIDVFSSSPTGEIRMEMGNFPHHPGAEENTHLGIATDKRPISDMGGGGGP